MENKPVVTITGVSGYLGSHVCLYFLKSGEFKVRGTVRSKTNAKKIEPLKKAFGSYFDELELLEADLMDKESLVRACEGSDFVVHTASPLPIDEPKNPDEVIKPAISGMVGVLEGCRKHKVKRCVATSSVVAVVCHKKVKPVYDESIWSDPEVGNAYLRSKTQAEKAAWDCYYSIPETERFEFSTILPGFIIGPALFQTENYSASTLKMMMLNKMPGTPKIQAPAIDVRDCAEAHFKALTVPEAAGQRFITMGCNPWYREMGELLQARYGKQYNVTRKDMSKCLVWIGALFKPELQFLLDSWGQETNLDTSKAARVLGMKYTPLDKSLYEMVDQMIECGVIPAQGK